MTPKYFKYSSKHVAYEPALFGSVENDLRQLSLNTYFVLDINIVRPVVNIRFNVEVVAGEGTETSPYELVAS